MIAADKIGRGEKWKVKFSAQENNSNRALLRKSNVKIWLRASQNRVVHSRVLDSGNSHELATVFFPNNRFSYISLYERCPVLSTFNFHHDLWIISMRNKAYLRMTERL